MRPILVKNAIGDVAQSALDGRRVEILAWTNVVVGTSVIKIPEKLGKLKNISVGMQAAGFGGQVTIERDGAGRIYNRKCASGWHLPINRIHPNQGFYRIWDHPVRLADLTETRLQEIHEVATRKLA